MRRFVLTNSKGEKYDLNAAKSFMADPSGLGYEYKTDYENYNDFFVETSREMKQPKVKGKIHFRSYEEYHNFIRFSQFRPLELEYKSYNTFYMACNVEKLSKAELVECGKLRSDIEIVGITPFYDKIIKSNTSVGTVGKTYPYKYPYTYAAADTGTVEFEVFSNMDSGVKMTMLGPLINPSWSYFVNGEKQLAGKINAEIASENRLVIDTTKSPYSIHEVNNKNEVVLDRYGDSDFTTKRFIQLKAGTNVITCTHEGTNTISMIMEAHVNYESV